MGDFLLCCRLEIPLVPFHVFQEGVGHTLRVHPLYQAAISPGPYMPTQEERAHEAILAGQ